jgi:hypothetical protein
VRFETATADVKSDRDVSFRRLGHPARSDRRRGSPTRLSNGQPCRIWRGRPRNNDQSGMIENMSENLEHLQYMPVWSNPLIDDPALAIENAQIPTAHDYAVFFRAAAPTGE